MVVGLVVVKADELDISVVGHLADEMVAWRAGLTDSGSGVVVVA